MNIPENIKTRIHPNGRLRKQLKLIRDLVHENQNSKYAKLILKSLHLKYWFGQKKIVYSSLYDEAWQVLLRDIDSNVFKIAGLKFRNDINFKMQFIDIFLSDPIYLDNTKFQSNDEYIAAKLLSTFYDEGSYQIGEVKLKKGDIVIDAGANMGLFSLLASTNDVSKVYAFEPQKKVIEILNENIILNEMASIIEIIPLGLSDQSGILNLSHQGNFHGSASIFFQRNDMNDAESIKCISLDNWVINNDIHHIDFIKADIEGAERNFLLGSSNILKEFSPRLAICTYHRPDDPIVLENIITKANPNYKILNTSHKLFAYVPQQ